MTVDETTSSTSDSAQPEASTMPMITPSTTAGQDVLTAASVASNIAESSASTEDNIGQGIKRKRIHPGQEEAPPSREITNESKTTATESDSKTTAPGNSSHTIIKDLPEGVELSWRDNSTTVVTFSPPTTLSPSSLTGMNQSERKDEDRESNIATATEICLVGRATLKCLQGKVQVLGYTLTPDSEPVPITSPYWSSWMTISVVQNENPDPAAITKIELSSIRGTPSFRLVTPNHRKTILSDSWKQASKQICRDLTEAPAPSMESLPDHDDSGDSSGGPLYHHPRSQRIVICGAKGVGKSTFLRYLTNQILQQTVSSARHVESTATVAILDADVGQPELAPPGLFRLTLQQTPLLQPPYWNICNSATPQFSNTSDGVLHGVFYGAVTSKVDPGRYIGAIEYLVQKYEEFLSHSPVPVPLIVNLDGWVKGLGFQILETLVTSKHVQPTHVCQIVGDTKGKTFDLSHIIYISGQEKEHQPGALLDTKLFVLDSCTNHVTPVHLPPSILRTLRLATYFGGQELHQLWDALDFMPAKQLQGGWGGTSYISEGSDSTSCVLANHLARQRPYFVPMESVSYTHVSMGYASDFSRESFRVLQALNGAIVGLCTTSKNHEESSDTVANRNCLGLGIVRSIDLNKRVLYILTPTPQAELVKVTHVVGGHLPLPISFLYRGVLAEAFPYFMTVPGNDDSDGDTNNLNQSKVPSILGSEPMQSRNNIARRGKAGPVGPR